MAHIEVCEDSGSGHTVPVVCARRSDAAVRKFPRVMGVFPGFVAMSYAGLEVADGQAAGLAWESIIGSDCGEVEREQKRKALLDYCGQDTLGLVRLLELLGSVRT